MSKHGYIRTYGSSKFGMGHIFRSMAVAEKLKQMDIDVEFLLFEEEHQQIRDIIDKSDFDELLLSSGCQIPPGDFLLYDMPYADAAITGSFKKSSPGGKTVSLDYPDSTDESIDVAISLFDHPSMLEGRENNKRTMFISGLEYAIIRQDFFQYKKNRTISSDIRKILVTFGGSDPQNHTLSVVKCISIERYDEVTAIIGPRFTHAEDIVKFARNTSGHLKVLDPQKSIGMLISEADLVICGAGTTMLETLFLGSPCIVIPQTEKEKAFGCYVQSKKACFIAEKMDEDNLLSCLEKVEPQETRIAMSEVASSLVPGHGVELIANCLLT